MTIETKSTIWRTIGFLQGISAMIQRADEYAAMLTEVVTSDDLAQLYTDTETNRIWSTTTAEAPTTYTDPLQVFEQFREDE